jgi:hypothetical protein
MKKKRKLRAGRGPSDSSSTSKGWGSPAGAGQGFSPAGLPDEEPVGTPLDKKQVPIGLPISTEEYDRLKKEAKKRKARSEAITQEDPGAKEHEDKHESDE